MSGPRAGTVAAACRRRAAPRILLALLGVPLALLVSATLPARADELLRDETSGLEYVEVLTAGAAETEQVPMVLALHGLGDRPESFRLLLDDLPAKARVIVPRAPMPHGDDGFSWFAFHADDEETGAELARGVSEATARVAQLVIDLAQKYGGPATAIVCGFSQGGMLTFALTAARPDLVVEAVPVSGYLPRALWPAQRPTTRPLPKVLALHGEADHLIPVQSARWSVEVLRSNGYDADLRTWPGVGHMIAPDIRSRLVAEVVRAVEEMSPPGVVLEGPPELVPPEATPAPRP